MYIISKTFRDFGRPGDGPLLLADHGDRPLVYNGPRSASVFLDRAKAVPGRDQPALDPLAVHGCDYAPSLQIQKWI